LISISSRFRYPVSRGFFPRVHYSYIIRVFHQDEASCVISIVFKAELGKQVK